MYMLGTHSPPSSELAYLKYSEKTYLCIPSLGYEKFCGNNYEYESCFRDSLKRGDLKVG